MSKVKGFVINRKMYQQIRKMDHCQMTLWAEALYKQAHADGMEAAKNRSLALEDFKAEIMKIKGIGEKKADLIVQTFDRMIQEKTVGDSKADS